MNNSARYSTTYFKSRFADFSYVPYVFWFASSNKQSSSIELLVWKLCWKTYNLWEVVIYGFKVHFPFKSRVSFHQVFQKVWPQNFNLR